MFIRWGKRFVLRLDGQGVEKEEEDKSEEGQAIVGTVAIRIEDINKMMLFVKELT